MNCAKKKMADELRVKIESEYITHQYREVYKNGGLTLFGCSVLCNSSDTWSIGVRGAGISMDIAKWLIIVFIILAVLSLIFGGAFLTLMI